MGILEAVKRELWSPQTHAIAYHLTWIGVQREVSRAEEDLIIAHRLLHDDDEDIEDAENPSVSRQTSFVEASLQPPVDLQEDLKTKHWESVAIKFEQSWEGHIVKDGLVMTKELAQDAVVLLSAGITLAVHFDQYEIGWNWAERSTLLKDWQILVNSVRLCRKAAVAVPDERELWKARAWVLYKIVLEYGRDEIIQNNLYIEFMAEV